eukprot:TRINITY_DN2061_c0_g1_i1.p1 TRINITY_DN2061_c0_g1~~TRINITY_DN2061_c0_g1_i1.p1  ORF type:complete len:324 (+),score=77.35 TRINITY_DN2061_c0_g1_i1:40-1011(+)
MATTTNAFVGPADRASEKKFPTSDRVYYQIMTDSRYDKSDFTLLYWDGLKNDYASIPITDWVLKGGDIPWHRVYFFKYRDVVVWDRESKQYTLKDIVKVTGPRKPKTVTLPAAATAAVSDPKQPVARQFEYLCILDFEATCDSPVQLTQPEIIEFPTVLVNCTTMAIEDEFHVYVTPVVNRRITPFCTELTGITQQMTDSGVRFSEALSQFDKWFRAKHQLDRKKCTFVTCGDWDLKTMIRMQCDVTAVPVPHYMREWINIKKAASAFLKEKHIRGMADLLAKLNLPLKGRHHSGIDDCRNIAAITIKLMQDGCLMQNTWKRR